MLAKCLLAKYLSVICLLAKCLLANWFLTKRLGTDTLQFQNMKKFTFFYFNVFKFPGHQWYKTIIFATYGVT